MTAWRTNLITLVEAIDAPEFGDVALCAQTDPEIFFPEKGELAKVRRARALCASCDLEQLCADYAVQRGELGIWGGTTERERRRIRAQQAGAPAKGRAA